MRNARIPATFTIRGNSLNPSTVASPAFIAIQLTIVSGDGRGHEVVVQTPTPHSIAVAASGSASTLLPGLKAGRYTLEVDGAARGALLIGGEPGP